MAVYTKFSENDIKEILDDYSIGSLNKFEGIQKGIENTNYFLLVDNKKYILTIYEKRVKEKDLPFFSELMSNLNKSGFKCPIPIPNKKNLTITEFSNKKMMIVSFVEGKAKDILSPADCKLVGREAARMHELTKTFKLKSQCLNISLIYRKP